MYKALTSFAGKLSMAQGEVKEITDKALVKDLLKAGYIEEVKDYASLLDKLAGNKDKKNKKSVDENTENSETVDNAEVADTADKAE